MKEGSNTKQLNPGKCGCFNCVKHFFIKIGNVVSQWTGLRWFRKLDAIEQFTFILAILAVLQFVAFVKSERAFVFPSTVKFVTWGDPSAVVIPLKLELEIANSGKNTANIEKLWAVVTHGPLGERPRYDLAQGRIEVVYPPVVREGKNSQILDFQEWPKETRDEVLNGKRNFYIYGLITYGDGWGLFYRKSQFCFRYDVDPAMPRQDIFRPCHEPEYTEAS